VNEESDNNLISTAWSFHGLFDVKSGTVGFTGKVSGLENS